MADPAFQRDHVSPGDSELVLLARRVVGWTGLGEEVEVFATKGVETDVRAYDGEVESLSEAMSAGVGIRVLRGGRQGFAYAGTLDERVVERTFAEARDNASFATPDEHVDLASPDGVEPVWLDLVDESLASLSTRDKVEMALDLERRVRKGDSRVRQVPSADYSDVIAEAAVVSSRGIEAFACRSACHLSVSAICGEGLDSHSGSGFTVGRGPGELVPDHAARQAIERAARLIGASKARSGTFTIVFDPRVTSTVLSVVSSALSGESVTKGRSFFADRLGEEVAVTGMTLVDDPTDPRAFGASTYDAEGLASRRNVLIGSGVLAGFVFDTTSARRAGVASTGSAVRGGYSSTPIAGCRALSLAPGSGSFDEIVQRVGDGMYVQSVTGVHSGVNPVSGDFSVGAEGLMIRGGALAEPVREVTIASTLQRMLQSVAFIGSDVDWLPGVAAGQTIAITGMTLSGQ